MRITIELTAQLVLKANFPVTRTSTINPLYIGISTLLQWVDLSGQLAIAKLEICTKFNALIHISSRHIGTLVTMRTPFKALADEWFEL